MALSLCLFFSLAISPLAPVLAASASLRGRPDGFDFIPGEEAYNHTEEAMKKDFQDIQEFWCYSSNEEEEAEEVEEQFREHACDAPDETPANASVLERARPLFLKFHKVGGTTIMNMMNGYFQIPVECGASCGECGCPDGKAVTCTGHKSKQVIKKLRKKVTFPSKGADLLAPGKLLPNDDRKRMLKKIGDEPWMEWLHRGSPEHQDLLMMTLLRAPIERIRSKYYFLRQRPDCETQKFCDAKNMSFAEWMRREGRDRDVCCEYLDTLGQKNVEQAKATLAELFDVVGITESMDEMLVEVARIFGAARPNINADMECRSNTENKQPWTEEEMDLAKKISPEDTEIYDFAVTLSKARMLSAWGSEAAIRHAIDAYRQGLHLAKAPPEQFQTPPPTQQTQQTQQTQPTWKETQPAPSTPAAPPQSTGVEPSTPATPAVPSTPAAPPPALATFDVAMLADDK